MTEREELIERAQNAITAVFSDTSVDQATTAADLEELQEFIKDMLNTLT